MLSGGLVFVNFDSETEKGLIKIQLKINNHKTWMTESYKTFTIGLRSV